MKRKTSKSLFLSLLILYKTHLLGASCGTILGYVLSAFAAVGEVPTTVETLVWSALFGGIGLLLGAMSTGNDSSDIKPSGDPTSGDPQFGAPNGHSSNDE